MVRTRSALILVVPMALVFVGIGAAKARQRASQPQETQQQPQEFPVSPFPPIGGRGRNNPPTDDAPPSKVDPRQQLKEAQKKISADVEHLLQLAQELKDESDKTKETDVLSLPLIHKTEEIEKLAKQIRDLARAD